MNQAQLQEFSCTSKTFVSRPPKSTLSIVLHVIIMLYVAVSLFSVFRLGEFHLPTVLWGVWFPLILLSASFIFSKKAGNKKVILTIRIDNKIIQAIYGPLNYNDGQEKRIRTCQASFETIQSFEYSVPLTCIRMVGNWTIRYSKEGHSESDTVTEASELIFYLEPDIADDVLKGLATVYKPPTIRY